MSHSRDINVNQLVVELTPNKRTKESVDSAFIESSTFIFQSSDCYLRINFGWENNDSRTCKVYIKSHPILSPKFYVTPYVCKGSLSVSYPKRLVLDPTKFIWSTPLSDIAQRLPGADKWNITLRFLFQTNSECLYDLKSSGHQSVQTLTYSSNNDSLEKLSDDFGRLLDRDMKHDIELKTGDFVIKADRTVLRARSKFFEKKLETFAEDELELPFIEPHAFNEIIRYMYTGKDPDFSWETAKKIYKAGDICNTGCLKERCVQFLIENITLENACELLALAEDESFKERVIGYVLEKEIPFLDEYWKPFCDDHPKLAIDVYYKLVRNLRQRRT